MLLTKMGTSMWDTTGRAKSKSVKPCRSKLARGLKDQLDNLQLDYGSLQAREEKDFIEKSAKAWLN